MFHVEHSKDNTMKAKHYIYRNLTRGGFSVKHKGKVIAHCDNILAMGATFRVNEKTRQRVLNEKKNTCMPM